MVAGKGVERLKNAGINVIVGVLKSECRLHHKQFFTVQEKKRPYIILKWARSKDGFIAPFHKEEQQPFWISNQYSQQLVHKWRAKEHAILVGTNTVIADNPELNVRSWFGNNPIRIVLDKNLRIPLNTKVVNSSQKTIFITNNDNVNKRTTTKNRAVEGINFSENVAQQICKVLQKHQIQSVIIEGGTQTLQTFIDENLWDEARVFFSQKILLEGVKAPSFSSPIESRLAIKNDVLNTYIND